MKKIKYFFLVIFLMSGYSGISFLFKEKCNSLYTKNTNTCFVLEKTLLPGAYFYRGIKEMAELIRIKLMTGEFLTTGLISSEDTRTRFKELKSGFNFNYQPGTRKNAGFLLLSRSSPEKNGFPSIEIWDLNEQRLINSYIIDLKKIRKKIGQHIGTQTQLRHPLLLDDGSIIVSVVGGINPLLKLDKCGNYVTHNSDEEFHHSLERDSKGNIFSPIKIKNEIYQSDDGFVILDEELKIKDKFSLADIFRENLMINDAINMASHLNDVQPLEKEDENLLILLSLREQSRIIAFEPKSKKIIWLIDNSTSKQHDIDLISLKDNKMAISIFDNNMHIKGIENKELDNNTNNLYVTFNNLPASNYGERINISTNEKHIEYGYDNISFEFLNKNYIPRTPTQGLSDLIKANNSLMVEESDNGQLFEIDINSQKIIWQYINKAAGENKTTYQLNWSRRLAQLPFKIKSISFGDCLKSQKKG